MMLNRVSLNTIGLNRIGLNRIGKPSRASSDRPYIDPEVLASLKVVCICYGKSNDDPDRAVVKNLVDPDNPFVISNAAYTEGSGYADKGSPYYGAFVTDGVEDLITSTKTVQEMLGGSNEITVVSMWANLDDTKNRINIIRDDNNGYCQNLANSTSLSNKYYIAGYSGDITSSPTMVTPLLGDKEDWKVQTLFTWSSSKFSVEGYKSSTGVIKEVSKVAWYWTIIANKVLTTDQINQVIAYYNLDRCVEPTVWYDVQKQGLSNDTPDSDWYLKDFSKNGFDMSLFNFAKKGNSGIGEYAADFLTWSSPNRVQKTSFEIKLPSDYKDNWVAYNPPNTSFKAMKVLISGIPNGGALQFFRTTADGGGIKMVNGINEIPAFTNTVAAGFYIDIPLGFDWSNLVITQIPSHAGGLCLDGVNDFGKVTGMPIYKDYTVVTDREIFANTGAISSKNNPGAFVETAGNSVYSFGQATSGLNFISTRSISYLSKYSYCGQSITAGAAEDGTDMWLGTIRDNDHHFFNGAIYSLMSFPYSMSEFLIERQLKKHKLGTLYPDMVEFRPIVKSNLPYSSISYSVNPGEYISVDSMVTITVTLPNTSDKLMEVSCNAISDISISGDNGVYEITGKVVKSPQKINLVISSYLTMLSNSTLISNETLIKNE